MQRNLLIFVIFLLIHLPLQAQQLTHVLGDLIIQLSPKLERPEALLSQYRQLQGKSTDWKVKKQLNQEMNIWLIHFDYTSVNEYTALRILKRHPLIQEVQFNHLLKKRNRPNDPFFGNQWNWVNDGANDGIVDTDIDADEAWNITTGGITPQGDTIVIAVLDDGVELEHNDLKDNLWKNHQEIPNNGIDDDQNGYIDDFHGWNVNTESDDVGHSDISNSGGHGTEVASLIGAVGNNALQITGINWNIKLMIIAPYGIGSDDEASALEGYSYALTMRKLYKETNGQQGAFVVATNSSWGLDDKFPEDAPIWCAFYDLLGQEGIMNTVATVNQNIDIDKVGDLPTTCTSPYLIGVSNSDKRDRKSFFAGYGTQSIDLFAPGTEVPILTRFDNYDLNGGGTSYSAPTVAGVIGLLYAAPCDNFIQIAKQNPMAATDLVRQYILEGVDQKNELVALCVTGGRLNANNSLLELLEDCGSCSTLFGVSFEEQTLESELTLNWVSDTLSTATVRFKPEGSTNWTTIEDLLSPHTFDQLNACTNYEFEIALKCEEELLPFNGPFKAATDGCCTAPVTIAQLAITDTGLAIEWPAVLSATEYTLEWKLATSNSWTTTTNTGNKSNLTALSPCTQYDLRVRPICPARTTEFSATFQFATSGCGACTDSTYCTSKGADATAEWIEQMVLNDLDNTSGKDAGYGDYSSKNVTLQTFTSYDIEIMPGFQGSAFPENYKVWIDYNQDGNFDNITEVATESSTSTLENFKSIISIPENAKLGLTRMRIAMVADFETIARTPCATYNFGEVEDYCVFIAEGDFQCLAPQNIQTTDTDESSARFDWEIGDSINQFSVRYRQINTSAWEETIWNAEDAFVLNSLIPCTNYEYQLLSNCSNSAQSDWSAVGIFSTTCDCSAPSNVQFTAMEAGLEITWDANPVASIYQVFYAKIDGSNVREIMVENSSILIQDFPECEDLNIAITPICLDELGATTEFPSVNSCPVSTTDLPAAITSFKIAPNPFKDRLFLTLTLKEPSEVNISLWNLAGQQVVSTLYSNQLTASTSFELSTTDLKTGIYLVKIQTEWGIVVSKVVKTE